MQVHYDCWWRCLVNDYQESFCTIHNTYRDIQACSQKPAHETVLENKELDNNVDKVQDRKAAFVLLACDYIEDCINILH